MLKDFIYHSCFKLYYYNDKDIEEIEKLKIIIESKLKDRYNKKSYIFEVHKNLNDFLFILYSLNYLFDISDIIEKFIIRKNLNDDLS